MQRKGKEVLSKEGGASSYVQHGQVQEGTFVFQEFSDCEYEKDFCIFSFLYLQKKIKLNYFKSHILG